MKRFIRSFVCSVVIGSIMMSSLITALAVDFVDTESNDLFVSDENFEVTPPLQ